MIYHKKTICFMSVLLIADLALAAPEKNRIGGILPTVFVGLRAIAHRLTARLDRSRPRTTPEQDALYMLQAMQTLLETMRGVTLLEAQAAFAQMEDLQRQYLEFIRSYGVLTNPEVVRLMDEARAVVTRLLQPVVTPMRLTVPLNDMSPTAMRLSERLEAVAEQAEGEVVAELRPLIVALQAAQEQAAQRAEERVEILMNRLEAGDLVATEVMTLRGAVQEILRLFQRSRLPSASVQVDNNGELLPSDDEGEEEHNAGELLPSDEDDD